MRSFCKKILLLCICLFPLMLMGQEPPAKDKAPASSKMQRKAAKKKWKEQRKAEMDHKKAVKQHHKRLQTKETRKRMKKERKKGEKMRANKREFFLVRWFKNRRY